MKFKILLILLSMYCLAADAQWSDKTNLFNDSLKMPVCTATNSQYDPIVVRSYPDKGYFVIWLDQRKDGETSDIYAQKYNDNGKALWAANGKPIVTGDGSQYYASSGGNDYRYNSYACTDSANGFYIVWEDQNVASHSTVNHRVMVQHVLSNGSKVFDSGYVIAQPVSGSDINYGAPQLIADGNKGFFVGFIRSDQYGDDDLYVFCYRDEGGKMRYYGGGQMNVSGINKPTSTLCGNGNEIVSTEAPVADYQLYIDNQHGCNVVMSTSIANGTSETNLTGFNRLCRVKKTCTATQRRRTDSIDATHPVSYHYTKDSVVQLYKFTTYSNTVSCSSNGNIYVVTNYYVENFGNGFLPISNGAYTSEWAEGVVIPTGSNINVNFMAADERRYINDTLRNYYTNGYFLQQEIYDSLPFQLCSSNEAYVAYNTIVPSQYAQLTNYTDTVITMQSVYPNSYHLVASRNRATIATTTADNNYSTVMQQFNVVNTKGKKYAVQYATANTKGIVIGHDVSTGSQSTTMSFFDSYLASDSSGHVFYALDENTHYTRVSPVGDSAALEWGAMGRPVNVIGYGASPYTVLDPSDGTGIIAWHSYNGSSNEDIFIRHLDHLTNGSMPAIKKITQFYSSTDFNYPAILVGSSNAYTMVEGHDVNGNLTPSFEVTDKTYLGVINSSMYQQPPSYSIRTYNNQPYLNRNYTILPDSASSIDLNLKLYISQIDFNTLKAADPSITSPSKLMAIQQNTTSDYAPSSYSPISGEKQLVPTSIDNVPAGYCLTFKTKKLGNFFLFKQGALLSKSVLAEAFKNTDNFIKNVYPTIVNGNSITIETGDKNLKEMSVELFNENGMLLYKKDGVSYSTQQLPIRINASGSYQLRITSGNNIYVTKLMKLSSF